MTSSIGKSYWPLVAAVGLGVGFVSYCLYFDQKRRNAPDFREKLRASSSFFSTEFLLILEMFFFLFFQNV